MLPPNHRLTPEDFRKMAEGSGAALRFRGGDGLLGGTRGGAISIAQEPPGLDFGLPEVFLVADSPLFLAAGLREMAWFPAGFLIIGWTLLTDQPDTFGVDLQLSTYANYPSATSIFRGTPPALAGSQKSQSVAAQYAIPDGSCLSFLITGTPAAATVVSLSLRCV
jgi:hypothetical protein